MRRADDADHQALRRLIGGGGLLRLLRGVGMRQSSISRETRTPCLAAAAASTARIARAILPCRPITLPISSAATVSRISTLLPKRLERTPIKSGLVTSDPAMYR